MKKRVHNRNYDLFSKYTFYTPGVSGMFGLFLWLLAGALLGNLVSLLMMLVLGAGEEATLYATIVAYPVMFIPAMIYASLKSNNNALFEDGFKMDNNHFSPVGALLCCLMVIIATLGASALAELVLPLLPAMPSWLEDTLGSMTNGNIWLDLLAVSIFAPVFEEWLCRGMVLRGLLNYKHVDKEGNEVNGIKPVNAILISALFFAVIHFNPWQAIPAFMLGCLFGYVYYKTGSLKLTMLMHFTNNTFAVIISHLPAAENAETLADLVGVPMYAAICVFSVAFIVYLVSKFKTIPMQSAQGNCDKVSA